jgi:hypothetical protein
VRNAQGLWRGLLGILGTGRRIGWLAVVEPYKAYLDESDIHDSARWCFVAGHLGTEEQWKEFDDKWRAGLGQRKFLHMKELHWNSKPERISRLLGKLGPIPDSCKLERIFGSVKGSHYLDVFKKHPELNGHFDPYMLALWPCVLQTLKHVPETERVLFTFENHIKYAPLLSLIENAIARDRRFLTPTGEKRAFFFHLSKGETPRTEPADYLAFEMGQFQLDQNSFKSKAGISIMGNHWMIGKQVSRKDIRMICENTLALAQAERDQQLKLQRDIKEIIGMSRMGRV